MSAHGPKASEIDPKLRRALAATGIIQDHFTALRKASRSQSRERLARVVSPERRDELRRAFLDLLAYYDTLYLSLSPGESQ